MPKLIDLAKVLRSKNAGPLYVTFDLMFDKKEPYERVVKSGVINSKLIVKLFKADEKYIEIVDYPAALSIKITIPRKVVGGDLGDRDVYGAQQYAPLLDLEIK